MLVLRPFSFHPLLDEWIFGGGGVEAASKDPLSGGIVEGPWRGVVAKGMSSWHLSVT